jgi:hypothetical protein
MNGRILEEYLGCAPFSGLVPVLLVEGGVIGESIRGCIGKRNA